MGLRKLKFLSVILLFSQITNADPKEDVLTAIERNDLQKVQSIIKNKNQANWEINKLSLLYYAAYDGHDLIADYLVEKGADILWNNQNDYSVLHAACHGCLGWLVEEILNQNARLVNKPIKGNISTPIEVASSVGCKIAVTQLLKTRRIINKVEGLKSALMHENYEIAQIIIETLDLNTLLIDGQPPLYYAYMHVSKPEAVELFLNNGMDINAVLDPNAADGKTLLTASIEERKPEIAKLCLRKGADFKRKFEYKEYGSPVQDILVLDLLFKRMYLGGYDPEKWIDVANLLIDRASADDDLLSITSDYKTVLDLSIKKNYVPITLNLVYQGKKAGIKIYQDNGREMSPEEYLAASSMNEVMPDSLRANTEGQEIFDAIDSNDVIKIKEIITPNTYYNFNSYKRIIKNGKEEQDAYIFDYAVNSGNIDIVKYLLSDDFSYSISNKDYYIAANNNDTEMFEFLVKANKNFDREGKWILFQIHKPAFVEILLKNGVNADEYIFNGQSFLFYEFRRGNIETINLFLKYSKELSNGIKKLFFAIEQDDIETARDVINTGIDINQPTSGGLTPLCWAAYLGRYDIAKLLIENNANVSISWVQRKGHDPYPVYGSAPLRWAIENGKKDIVKLLIEHNASPIIYLFLQERLNSFHLAAINGNVEIMKMLMEAYGSGNVGFEENASALNDIYSSFRNPNNPAIYNNKIATPFDIAAYYGNIPVCQLFLDHGFGVDNPDKQDRNYYTPLYFAVAGKQLETARFLLAKGAKVTTDEHNTIVQECTWNGTGEILKLLINNGAHVNTKELLDAAKHVDQEAVKAVVRARGSSLKLKENSFELLLGIIKNDHLTDKISLIDYLIDNGLDINAQGENGATLLHLAVEAKNEEMVTFLLKKEVEINLVAYKKEGYSKRVPKTALDLTTFYPIYKQLKEQGAKSAPEIL